MFETSFLDINDKFLDAAAKGDKRKVKKYLSRGVNVDCVNLNGQTALYLSVLDGRKELVEILLKNAADPNFRTLEGTTPLHMAVYKGDLHIVSYLIEAGGDLRLHDFKGKSIYDWAEKQKDVKKKRDVLDFLEKKKLSAININSAYSYKETTAILNKTLDYKTISSWKPLSLMKKKVKSQSSYFSSTILSDGFGKIMLNNGEETSGVVGPIPLVALTDLRHDSFGYTWANGPFTVMESMLWKEEPITLKRLHTQPRQGGHVDLLINELKHLLELRHSSLLLLMGTCRSEDLSNLMLVFERIHTGSLFAFIHQKKEPLADWEGCRLLSQVCEGVMYLHRKQRIHCNITSHAIFVVRQDLAKLGNFEYMVKSAASTCSAANISTFSTFSGTCFAHTPNQVVNNRHTNGVYNWMSPEIMSGKMATTSSDLYSLCCVLWEVLHGQIPWKNQSANQIAHKVLDEGTSLHSCEQSDTLSNSGDFFKATLTFGLALDTSDRQITLSQLQNQLALYVKDHMTTDAHPLFSTWSPPKQHSWRTNMQTAPSRPPRKGIEPSPSTEKQPLEFTPLTHFPQERSFGEGTHDKPFSARFADSFARKPGRFTEGPPLSELRAQELLQSKPQETTMQSTFENTKQQVIHEDNIVKEETKPKLTFNISDIERALGERKKDAELKDECKEKSFTKNFKLNSSVIGNFFSKMSHSRDSSFKYQSPGQGVLAKCQKFVTRKLTKKETSLEKRDYQRIPSTLSAIHSTTLPQASAAVPVVPITLENEGKQEEYRPSANFEEDGFNVAKYKPLACKSEDTKLNVGNYELSTGAISPYSHKSENEISKELGSLNFKSSIPTVKTYGNNTDKPQKSDKKYSSIYNPAKRAFFNLTPVSEFKNTTDIDVSRNDELINNGKKTEENKIYQKHTASVHRPPSNLNLLENTAATLKSDEPTIKPLTNKTFTRAEVDPKKKRMSGMDQLASSLTSPIKPKPRHSPSPRQVDAAAGRKNDVNNVDVAYIPPTNVHQKLSLPYKKEDNHSYYLNPRPFYKNRTSSSVHKRPLTTFERLERDLKKETENFIEGKRNDTQNTTYKNEMTDTWRSNTISSDLKSINNTGTKKSLYFKSVLDKDVLGLSPLQVHACVEQEVASKKANDIDLSGNKKEHELVDHHQVDFDKGVISNKISTEITGTVNSTNDDSHISTSELNYVFANINQLSSQSEQHNKYLKIPKFNDSFVQTEVGAQNKEGVLNDKGIDDNKIGHKPIDNTDEKLKMNSSSVFNKKMDSGSDASKSVASSVGIGLNDSGTKVNYHAAQLQRDFLYFEANQEFELMNHKEFKDLLNLEYKYKLKQTNKLDNQVNESFNSCALKSFSCTETDKHNGEVGDIYLAASDSRIQGADKDFGSPSIKTPSSEYLEDNYVILNENGPLTQRPVMKKTTSPYNRSAGQSKPCEKTTTYKETPSSFRKSTQKYNKVYTKSKDTGVISQFSTSPSNELNSRKRIFDASLSELKSVMSQKNTLECKRPKAEVSVEKQVEKQQSKTSNHNLNQIVENAVKDNAVIRRASNSHQGAIETLKMALQNSLIYNESLSKGVQNNGTNVHKACKPVLTSRQPMKMSPLSPPSFRQFSPPTFQQYSPFPFGPSDNSSSASKPASHFSCKARSLLRSPRSGMCSMVEIDTRPHTGDVTYYSDALNNTRFSKSSAEVYRENTSHDEEKPPLQEIVKNFEEKMLEHVKMQSILIKNKKKTDKSDVEASSESKQKLVQPSRHKTLVDQHFKPTHKSFVFANITPINSPSSLPNHPSHQPTRQEDVSKIRRKDRFHVVSEPLTSVRPLSCHSSSSASPIQPAIHTSKLSIQVKERSMKDGTSAEDTMKPKTPPPKHHTTTLVITARNDNPSQNSIAEKAKLQQQIKQQQQQILQIQQQQQQIQEQQQQLKEKRTLKAPVGVHKEKVEDCVKSEAPKLPENIESQTLQAPSENIEQQAETNAEPIIEPLDSNNIEKPIDIKDKTHDNETVKNANPPHIKALEASNAEESSVQEQCVPLGDGNTDRIAAPNDGQLSGGEGGVGKQDDAVVKGSELKGDGGEDDVGKPGSSVATSIKNIIEELNKKTIGWKEGKNNKVEHNINNVNNILIETVDNRISGSYSSLSNSQCTVFSTDTSDKTLVNSCFSSYNTMYNSNQSNITLTTEWNEESIDVTKSRSTGTVVDDDIVEGKGLSRKSNEHHHVMSSDSDMVNNKWKFAIKDIPTCSGIGVVMGAKDVLQDNKKSFTTEVKIEYDMEGGDRNDPGCINNYATERTRKGGDLFNLVSKSNRNCPSDSFSIMKRFEEDLSKYDEEYNDGESCKRSTESEVVRDYQQRRGGDGCCAIADQSGVSDDRDDSCKDDASRFVRWNFE